MTEYAGPGFVQNEVPKRLIFLDPGPLLPDRLTGGGWAPPTMTSPTSPSA